MLYEKYRSDIASENEWVRTLQSANYPVLLKWIFVCYLYCFAFLTHLRLLSWFPFKLFKLLNALWPRPMASNNSMNLVFKSLHEVNSAICSEHAWLLLIICSKHCFVPIINIYLCISKSTFWFQSNLVICSLDKLVRCYSFVHSSAHTLLIVILEILMIKFFCELSVREPFSSLDGLVERNLNKKEWQYRAWNFIKRTFLKCCTLLTGGKKAPPDRPEYKNGFLDQTQSPAFYWFS